MVLMLYIISLYIILTNKKGTGGLFLITATQVMVKPVKFFQPSKGVISVFTPVITKINSLSRAIPNLGRHTVNSFVISPFSVKAALGLFAVIIAVALVVRVVYVIFRQRQNLDPPPQIQTDVSRHLGVGPGEQQNPKLHQEQPLVFESIENRIDRPDRGRSRQKTVLESNEGEERVFLRADEGVARWPTLGRVWMGEANRRELEGDLGAGPAERQGSASHQERPFVFESMEDRIAPPDGDRNRQETTLEPNEGKEEVFAEQGVARALTLQMDEANPNEPQLISEMGRDQGVALLEATGHPNHEANLKKSDEQISYVLKGEKGSGLRLNPNNPFPPIRVSKRNQGKPSKPSLQTKIIFS